MPENKLKVFSVFTLILSISILSLFYEDQETENLELIFKEKQYKELITKIDRLLNKDQLSFEETKKVYVLKAVSEYELHQELNAEITFLKLLKLDNNISIDPEYLSADAAEFFNALKVHYTASAENKIIGNNHTKQISTQ